MNLSASFGSGRLTVFLKGELDHHAAKPLIGGILELIDEYMPRECVLELGGLTFMDSSGIAVIINACKKMRTLGGRIMVENAPEQARKVLEASGVDRLLSAAMSI